MPSHVLGFSNHAAFLERSKVICANSRLVQETATAKRAMLGHAVAGLESEPTEAIVDAAMVFRRQTGCLGESAVLPVFLRHGNIEAASLN